LFHFRPFYFREGCGSGKLTAVHARIEEVDLGSLCLSSAADEAVALIDALGSVDGKYLHEISKRHNLGRLEMQLTQAQLTNPHIPPAMTTAKGVLGELPRALAKTCFTLSYVMK